MTGTVSVGLVGRHADSAHLRELVAELAAGQGGLEWVEGEPGIGKTALLAEAFAGAAPAGCQVFWGACDELAQRLPLRVLTECLQVRETSADPQRAEIARLLRGRDFTGPTPLDVVAAAVQRLVGWVEQVSMAAPVLLVVDDAQWSDEASLLVLAELARLVGQIPLLLAVAARPVPRRPEVLAARRTLLSRGAVLVSLHPLPPDQVSEMAGRLLGVEPGPELRSAIGHAGGNPLYVREIVDALVRERRTEVADGRAEVDRDSVASLASLASPSAAIADRLHFLSEQTAEVLRLAALLGADFAVDDLAVASGRDPLALVPVIEEALAAGVLAESGTRLAFRHELIRQALAESMPAPLRSALHGQVARTLIESGAAVERAGAQLLAAADSGLLAAGWVLDWLAGAGLRLVYRATSVAVELLRAALPGVPESDPRREVLSGHLLTALWLLARMEELEPLARRVIAHGRDGERLAQAAWILAYAMRRSGRLDDAGEVIEAVLADPRIGGVWADRLRSARALTLQGLGRQEEAAAAARDLLSGGGPAPDRYAAATALHVLSMVRAGERDFEGTMRLIEQALDVLEDDLESVDLRLVLLANRNVCLLNLDRAEEAGRPLAEAVRLAEDAGSFQLAVVRSAAGQQMFQTGRWDEALAELTPVLPVGFAVSLVVGHGMQALIALHRDDRPEADAALAAMAGRPTDVAIERASSRYLLAARALAAERDGRLDEAVATLRVVLDPPWDVEMAERWGLLAALVRAALAAGDPALAEAAARASAAEAEQGGTASRLVAADHTRGLVAADPDLLLDVAERYQALLRPLEAAQAAEDAGAAYAQRGDTEAARAALTRALDGYAALGAEWDIGRVRARFRAYGIRRSVSGARPRETSGWGSLSPTEAKVAGMIAEGMSNPQIADRMFLSKRTVETHISHIFGKLGLRSRVEIAREASRHAGAEPEPATADS